MSHAQEIVERFRSALYGHDPHTARQQLADSLSFEGPAAHIAGADGYMKATEHVVRSVKGVETRKILTDDADVAVFYQLHIDHSVGSITVVDWYHVEGAKITSICTILDTGPFTQLSRDTAVDPVCGMTVDKGSAIATRMHADTRYYFCNVGCAESFDASPGRYASQALHT
jgi:YHS domain-containing protein